jgi:hypothetical protein
VEKFRSELGVYFNNRNCWKFNVINWLKKKHMLYSGKKIFLINQKDLKLKKIIKTIGLNFLKSKIL